MTFILLFPLVFNKKESMAKQLKKKKGHHKKRKHWVKGYTRSDGVRVKGHYSRSGKHDKTKVTGRRIRSYYRKLAPRAKKGQVIGTPVISQSALRAELTPTQAYNRGFQDPSLGGEYSHNRNFDRRQFEMINDGIMSA